MQIQQSAALTWLSDEVRQTLSTADTELAKLANAGLNQTEQSAILNAVRGHIDSCYSAFDLTGCDALCRYCAALIASLDKIGRAHV